MLAAARHARIGRRNCNVNLDELRWDRPDLGCEPQQARGITRNLQLDETDKGVTVLHPLARSGPATQAGWRVVGWRRLERGIGDADNRRPVECRAVRVHRRPVGHCVAGSAMPASVSAAAMPKADDVTDEDLVRAEAVSIRFGGCVIHFPAVVFTNSPSTVWELTTRHGLGSAPPPGGKVAGPREISRRFDTDLKY